MYGLKYNYTSLFAERVYSISHYYEENITFHIHTVSVIPVAFRFSMGQNIKYFIEAGMSLGLSVANKKGKACYKVESATLIANPYHCYVFDHWTWTDEDGNDHTSTEHPLIIPVNGDINLIAHFIPKGKNAAKAETATKEKRAKAETEEKAKNAEGESGF